SDSPGRLTQRKASARASPVAAVGRLPSARPGGLHHWLSAVGPSPLRLVSSRKCLPTVSPETASPYDSSVPVVWKLDTFSENPCARSTPARSRRLAVSAAGCQVALPASRYTSTPG